MEIHSKLFSVLGKDHHLKELHMVVCVSIPKNS